MRDVIAEMSSKSKGMTCVVGDDDELLGSSRTAICATWSRRRTDGWLLAWPLPVTVRPGMLAAEALNVMGGEITYGGRGRVAGASGSLGAWRAWHHDLWHGARLVSVTIGPLV
jgi:hypothetical protein